ncbi:MAG: hypothetical protein ABIO39_11660 [Caulobacteraceae bacterium]
MKTMRILLIGQQPESVDYSDPTLPPGMNAETIYAGLAVALRQMADRGWTVDHCYIQPDETAVPEVERQLGAETYDCVVIGGGVRIPPSNLLLFEALINAIHRGAPKATIAFNSRPENTADAAARWLPAE